MAVVEVVVLIPVKPLAVAKSRLRHRYGSGTGLLALAMALDVIAAARAADSVAAVAVVANDPVTVRAAQVAGAVIVPDLPDRGLNPALASAAARLRAVHPHAAFITQPGDCPAVRAADFDAVAAWVATNRARCFVADAAGMGTTTLAAPPGAPLGPRYGEASRSAHLASGAVELCGPRWDHLRRDVDIPNDLAQAHTLGLGANTLAWLAALETPQLR